MHHLKDIMCTNFPPFSSDFALCYNDRSVLENHHLHYAFKLLREVRDRHIIKPIPMFIISYMVHKLMPSFHGICTGGVQYPTKSESRGVHNCTRVGDWHGSSYRHVWTLWTNEADEAIALGQVRPHIKTVLGVSIIALSHLVKNTLSTSWFHVRTWEYWLIGRTTVSCLWLM